MNHIKSLKASGFCGCPARFLILEGHLDDTYYQYTSLFHSGRPSPNDNKFLIQIRAFTSPDPGFSIDNPKEVIAAMRDEDFGQSYVLNVKLVDCLLSDVTSYSDQVRRFFEFIASHFDSSEDFLEAYYATGRDVSSLLSGLVEAWKGFVPTVVASKRNLTHVTQLVANLPDQSLATMASNIDELPEFVAANLPEILALAPELAPERLGRQLRRLIDTSNTASDVWADSAYRSTRNEPLLKSDMLKSRIHRRKPQGRPIPENMARANAAKSAIRARVEHVFAHQKNRYRLFIRTIGIARAQAHAGQPRLQLRPPDFPSAVCNHGIGTPEICRNG